MRPNSGQVHQCEGFQAAEAKAQGSQGLRTYLSIEPGLYKLLSGELLIHINIKTTRLPL